MGKKSKRTRTKQTEKENMDAKKNVVSAVREAFVLGLCYSPKKEKKKSLSRGYVGGIMTEVYVSRGLLFLKGEDA